MSTLDESQYIVETGEQKLERVGRTEVVTGSSIHGALPVINAHYPTAAYKTEERFSITQENPVDSGQGYQFTNTDSTEV